MSVEQDLQNAVIAINDLHTVVQTNLNTLTSSTNTAVVSANSASNSAVQAANSATQAASFATNAANSATQAANSATNAANSATAAANSSTQAANAAVQAANSATQAANSATNAANSASQALGYSVQAANSATNAANSAVQAAASATQAANSFIQAANSATAAANSATAAANSAAQAANSAANAASIALTTLLSVANVATLRTTAVSTTRDVNLAGYYSDGDGGGGQFYGVTAAAANTYVDNGGTIIVPTGGNGNSAWVALPTGTINVKQFGAKGDGVTNDSAAIQAAITAAFNGFANTNTADGVTVYIPPGEYVIGTTLNLNGFNSNATANIPVNYTKRLKIIGAGSGSTRLIGGEIGYGFFELIAANSIWFEGFTVYANRSSNFPRYGFCGGRSNEVIGSINGNNSSGYHTFRDIHVTGKFSFGAMFMNSSEVNYFEHCTFYPQIGHGCIMAMNPLSWKDQSFRFTVSGITTTPSPGAVYTIGGVSYTVTSAAVVSGSGFVEALGFSAPAASSTLTKFSGSGDASVTYSAFVKTNTNALGIAAEQTTQTLTFTGTVSATNGNTTITGSGTNFTTAAFPVLAGDNFVIDGTTYTIASVASGTSLTLTTTYAGTTGSGKSFQITRNTFKAKYGTFGTGIGGNGDNQFTHCSFLGLTENDPTDIPVAHEYAQAFRMTSCYFATSTNRVHIYLRKSASGTIQNSFHEQYGSIVPISVYFAADDVTDPMDFIDYRDIKITNSRLLRIFGENQTRVTNMSLENSVFRGTLNNANTSASFTGTITSNNTLTTSANTGNILVGQVISGFGVPIDTTIVSGNGTNWAINYSTATAASSLSTNVTSIAMTGNNYHVDLAKVYDSRIENSNQLSNVTTITDVTLRVRQEGFNNYYRGFNANSMILPAPALDTIQLTASDSVALSDAKAGGVNFNTAVTTGSIANTTLTISAVSSGNIALGSILNGTGINSNSTISSQITQTLTFTGTVSATNGSNTITGSTTNFTTAAFPVLAGDNFVIDNTTYTVGSVANATSLTLTTNYANTTGSGKSFQITRNISTGTTGGIGTYQLYVPQNVTTNTSITANNGATFTGTISNTTLTVVAVSSGSVTNGTSISGTNINSNTVISSQLTGNTGGVGTYQVYVPQTVSSTTVNIGSVNNGTFATLSSGNVPNTNPFAMMLDFVCPSNIDSGPRMLFGLGTASFNLSAANTVSVYYQSGVMYFRSYGPTSAGECTYKTADPSFITRYAGKRLKMLVVKDSSSAPTVYINGYRVGITPFYITGGRSWSDPVNGNIFLTGFQSVSLTTNAPTTYYSAALFNYAPNAAKAYQLTTAGIGVDPWGTSFGGVTNGCIGYWDFESGGGSTIIDQSPFSQTATITGPFTRYQNINVKTGVQKVDTISDLRKTPVTKAYDITLGGYYVDGDGGGGMFYGVTGAAPGTYVDNTGTIIVPTGGNGSAAWLRIYNGPVNVSWFGAMGGGVTNEYLFIYRAAVLAAAQGNAIELVSGKNYLCSSLLGVTCSIIGNGATISGQIQLSASNTFIRDLNVVSPLAAYAIYLRGELATPITNVQMYNVGVSFSGGTPGLRLGVSATYVNNLVIDNCRIDYGINNIRCANYRFTNNILNGYGVNENELIHATVRSYGIIENNTFLNALDNWLDVYSSGEKTVINGNRFDGCTGRLGTGIEIKVTLSDNPDNTSGGPNDYGYDHYIVFTNNYVGGYSQPTAVACSVLNIYYIDNRATPLPINWADPPRAIVVSGNVFDGLDTTNNGSQQAHVITVASCESIIISDNIFKNICVGGTPADVSACVNIVGSRNIVVADNIMNSRGCTGIGLHQTCDNIQITGNQIVTDTGNSYTPVYGIYGVTYGSEAVAALSNITVSANKLEASVASARMLNTSGSVTDMIFSNNICTNEVVFEIANKCTFNNNIFAVSSSRFRAFQVGYSGAICAFNSIIGNTIYSPSASKKPGIQLVRCRASIVSQNIIHTPQYGIMVSGTNTAGELDYLVIKDNFSISQSADSFPFYSSMSADDAATLQIFSSVPIPFTATPNASFTGVIASGTPTKLTTSSVNGTIIIGATLTGVGVPAGVTIASQDPGGTTGGAGVYNLSASITGGLTSRQMNTLGAVTFGIINSNQKVT